MIVGDNVLRSVYSVHNFGDFDASGNMGAPYVKLLSIVDPDQASKDFATARGTVARTNITYNAANSTAAASDTTSVTLSEDITDTLHKITIYFPIMLAVLGLNVVVILLLAIAAFIYLFRRRNVRSARNRRNARPLQLNAMSTDTLTPPSESLQRGTSHTYQPVSIALTDDTFVPPSPAFHYDGSGGSKARPFDDRPNSVA